MRQIKLTLALACAGALLLGLSASSAGAATPTAKLVNERRAVAPPSAPPAVKKMIADETKKWGDVIRATGIKLDL